MTDPTKDLDELDPLASCRFPSYYAGQKVFTQGDDHYNNALLGWGGFPMDTYAAGYRRAAETLVEAVVERRAPIDMLIYPMVFLYRQALELELKLILPMARRLAGVAPGKDLKHFLMPLWQELRRHLHQLGTPKDDVELPAIEAIIQQLHAVDPGSFAFRYPADTKGEVSLPNLKHVNVRHLAEVMDSAFTLLGAIHSQLGEMDGNDGVY